MAQGRKGNKTVSKLAILLLGGVGSHKSEVALEMSRLKTPTGKPFKVLYIDVENGSVDDRLARFEKDYGIDPENIWIVYTQSMKEVLDLIDRAKNNEDFYDYTEDGDEDYDSVVLDGEGKPFRPDGIVIDGAKLLTESTKMTLLEVAEQRADVRISKKENVTAKEKAVIKGNVKLEPTDYAIVNNEGVKLVLKLVGSGKHFVITSFSKDETVEDETGAKDSFGNVKRIKTGKIIQDSFKGMLEYCKTVLSLEADEFDTTKCKAYVERKDRTEKFVAGSVVEDFSLTMFQDVIDKSKDTKSVKYSYEDSIKKDAEAKLMGDKDNEKVKVTENVSLSLNDLRKAIKEELEKDGVSAKKVKMSKVKEKGFGNPAKETSVEVLQNLLDMLKSL